MRRRARLADGRGIDYRDFGDPDGAPAIYLHGTHGRKDPAAPFAFAERARAEIPNATLHAFAGEGHFVFHSHADEIAESIVRHAAVGVPC